MEKLIFFVVAYIAGIALLILAIGFVLAAFVFGVWDIDFKIN